MDSWESRFFTFQGDGRGHEAALNQLCREGWEPVGLMQNVGFGVGAGVTVLLKRRLPAGRGDRDYLPVGR